ncbi:glycosyltransferase family 2 protein [Enterococcus canintestini]|uniref:glycosyltransferase family 2 protein n=1 Tax=Enterococcus canintestini TaxID=317010 RepID=UPI00288DEF45|nr:glycosyltransferase family 2 protein [Enterococcus canintestini]MDT2740341.1 glycosyltransferase family 2 protein [Enterococcus canintestini]
MNLSVVIPIYNAEKFLKRCLDSIINQTFSNFEVILINDGSSDTSGEICRGYVKKDNRFQYYEIENAGVSNARNVGISYCANEYLTFIDADDYLDATHFQLMLEAIASCDMVVSGYKVIEGNQVKKMEFGQDTTLGRKELIHLILTDLSVFSVPWNKIFRREIISRQNTLFDVNISYGEDLVFNIEYALHCDSAVIKSIDTYNYVHHSESASGNLIEKGKLLNRMTDIDAMIKTIRLLEIDYSADISYLNRRIAREGNQYIYLAKKLGISKIEIEKFKKKIKPYTYEAVFKGKKNYKWFKLIGRISLYRLRALLF